jgi:hypothetical protein
MPWTEDRLSAVASGLAATAAVADLAIPLRKRSDATVAAQAIANEATAAARHGRIMVLPPLFKKNRCALQFMRA